MDKIDIENAILKQFYKYWEKHQGNTVYVVLEQLAGIEKDYFLRVADALVEANLIKGVGPCVPCDITPFGIIEAESRGLVPQEKLQRYEKVRYEILQALAELNRSEGRHAHIGYSEINEKHEMDKFDYLRNISFLREIGLVKDCSTNSFKITEIGLKQFESWEKQKFFNDEFERISKLAPQSRGIELEKLIAEVLDFAGWNPERNVTTLYEQIDVIISYNREFYLVECKWEKNPIEAEVIDKLSGKLGRRAGTNGILMSMSGFTSGCEICVKDFSGQKLFLLFGKTDIEQIISNPQSFEELFNHKYKELVMRRNVDWK